MYDDDNMDGQAPGPIDDRLQKEKDKDALIAQIQAVLDGGHSVENENSLIGLMQSQRRLLLDIATQTFINKPNNPKLLDSINTILAQMEKTVRDNRKERLKDRELEDNKANFSTFVNALNEISAGRIKMPDYGDMAIILDPLAPVVDLSDDPDSEIREEEYVQGRQILDSNQIKESFEIDEETPVKLADEDSEDEFDPDM
ncbi:hypothetical protein PQD71_gp210 [Kosakonia phage Kc263]|uniref:Uncharacterized protein n=1 Tax=Kosakonia phage Kc263 TaxID=2863194 RepID=A0AAE7WGV1_9CAUD|nr:hypothetical protein PQD71_gp210 [Kosakonia phage Kc263]QYN80116.1 hypothetical protein [Kosakonia phage Kc263]